MEKKLFSWEEWDQLDTMCFQFLKCNLKVNVSGHNVGDKIPLIMMDYEKGIMDFFDEEGNITDTYEIFIGIGDKK